MKKVAVVILGWNGKKFLEQFLPSVIRHTSAELCEIIVADNCSTDGSVDFVTKNYPSICQIQNKSNNGFAGGYNEALKQVNAKYYVLLNQDVEVTENWIERVIEEMERDENVAAAQPKLRSYHQRDHFEYAGACGGYLDRHSYAFCRGRIFDFIEKDEGQYDERYFIALSYNYFVQKEFEKCISAAKQILKYNRGSSAAYNNICSAYNELEQFQKALDACNKGLKLAPNEQILKNNKLAAERGLKLQ